MSMIGSYWAEEAGPVSEKRVPSERIADAIIKDLCGRRGLRHAWEGIDADIQKEIRETWAMIVRAGL
jgi:hypothetical protein